MEKSIGDKCREFRIKILKETQTDFARAHKTTRQNICNFEKGYTKSGKILLMYVEDGFKYE